MEFKKPSEDEEVKAPSEESEEEDDLDLEEKEEAKPEADEESAEDEEKSAPEEVEGDESESEEEDETEPVPEPVKKKGKASKGKSAPVLDEEDASKNLEAKSSVVHPVEKIGDLIEDRRYALREKARLTREHLAAQPMIRMMIPRSENEAKDASQYYNINGFAFYLLKGKYVSVPEDVAQLISDTYGQDARIVADHPLNLTNNASAAKEFSR